MCYLNVNIFFFLNNIRLDLFVFGVHTKRDDNGGPTCFRIVRGKTFSFSLINNYAHAFLSGQQRRSNHIPDIRIVFVLSVVCGVRNNGIVP